MIVAQLDTRMVVLVGELDAQIVDAHLELQKWISILNIKRKFLVHI